MFSQQARWDRKMPGDHGEKWEHAEVTARFAKGKIVPLRFILGQGARCAIEKINFSWSERHGNAVLYFFSVTDKTESYRLCLDTETMSWLATPLQ
ncbi:MAG: hypothetical protein ACM3OC_03275 [Deltaproteobacteria bacterium]